MYIINMVEKFDILCGICGKKYQYNSVQNLEIKQEHKYCQDLVAIKKKLELEILNID